MRSKLFSGTGLLVALLGMSVLFGTGCTGRDKKKKDQKVTQAPAKKDSWSASSAKSGTSGAASSSDGWNASGSPAASDAYGSGGYDGTQTASAKSKSVGAEPIYPGTDELGGGASTAPVSPEAMPADLGADPGMQTASAGGASDWGMNGSAVVGAEAAPEAPVTAQPSRKKKKKKRKSAPVSIEAPSEASFDEGGGSASGSYTIKSGDTLSKIAKRNGISLSKLMKINSLKKEDATKLKVGSHLKLS